MMILLIISCRPYTGPAGLLFIEWIAKSSIVVLIFCYKLEQDII